MASGQGGGVIGNIGPALRLLVIYKNSITGSIPAEVGQLTGLLDFSLDQNELTGRVPSKLGNLVERQLVYLAVMPLMLCACIVAALAYSALLEVEDVLACSAALVS